MSAATMADDAEVAGVTEPELRARFPFVTWGVPVPVLNPHDLADRRFACRYCIAMYGLRGADYERLWGTPQEVLDHIRQFHLDDGGDVA